ncbi:Hypothetical_protein [Hexamita inflata]|uniref:Hypothetical_protein n=1 Tax=Hexamita inflata TaxID=28002 RepID=A0AA86Q5V3_9EUKA|nr:Hypothetical protein HINF_LOCUS37793 [Hexamita inflata]
MDQLSFKVQNGNNIIGVGNNQLVQYNLCTCETRTQRIDFPISNSQANAYPTVRFMNDYYCIPFDESKLQKQQKLSKMTPSSIVEVCVAPNMDMFGYASTSNSFLCFDWATKQFMQYKDNQFVLVQSLTDLKLTRVHLTSYLDYFVVVSWDEDSILLVNERFEVVKTVKLWLNPFIDFWFNAVIDHVLVLYVHQQNTSGCQILVDLNELFAKELPNSRLFSSRSKYVFKAVGRSNLLRRPFVVEHQGQKCILKNNELIKLDGILRNFEGYEL